MAAQYSVATKILGEDFASEAFRKVGAAAKSAFAPITGFNKAVSEPSTSALGRVGSAVDGISGKFRSGLGSITAWLPALGAIGAIGSLSGLIAMTRHAAEGYEGLSLAAKKLGASTGDLSVWRFGAKLAGVESEKLDKSLVILNKTMFNAATGKNKDAAGLFAAMKIPLKDANGGVKNVSNSLEDIAEAFKNTGNAATRDAAAMMLFGKSGADLLPFLMKGRAGIIELRAEMKKYSGLTDKNREDLEHLAESYKKLDKAGSGLSSKLSAVFAPSLSAVSDATADWILANRDLIAQSLERKLTKIGQAFLFVKESASSIATYLGIDSWLKATEVSTMFDVGLGALGMTMAGPVLAAVQFLTGRLWAMNKVIYANPWILLLAAIALTAYTIYANWGPITEWFSTQMTAIREAFDQGFVSGLIEVWKRLNPVRLITAAIGGLGKWLLGVDLFAAGHKMMKSLIDGVLSLLPNFQTIWAPIQAAMEFAKSQKAGGPGALAIDQMGAGASAGASPAFGNLPSPPSPDSPASLSQGNQTPGKVDIKVNFENLPKGAEVKSTSSNVGSLESNVGRSMHDAYGA
jgi:hypothetical protein